MKESTTYQAILDEGFVKGERQGLAKGREEGLEEGIEKGVLKGKREILLRIAQKRLGEPSAAKWVYYEGGEKE